MSTRPAEDFRAIQRAFAAHLRDPDTQPAPAGIEARRLAIYQELFFNNVEGLLRGFFPVLHALYDPDDWRALVRAYYAMHRAETPYFLRIAEEFLAYLETGHAPRPCDPPYLRELAHYEWLELALDVAEEALPASGHDPAGNLLDGVPVVSPLVVLARYDWPVHRIAAQARDVAPEETFLVVYRDRGEQVRFQALNAVSARLLSLLQADAEGSLTGRDLALQIAAELGSPDPAAVLAGAADTLAQWRDRDILIGTRPSAGPP